MSDTFLDAAALIVPMVCAIVFHEIAHGLSAKWLGDPTAEERGRLSLNPLRHVDLMGTIIVPGALALMGMPVFGWAKPVPVVPQRMRNPKRGMMISAAAGPISNFVQALIGSVLLGLLMLAYGGQEISSPVMQFVARMLIYAMAINVSVGLFNLLPIPSFDGSHIVEGLLPTGAARTYGSWRRYGTGLALILIVVIPQLVPGFHPISYIIGKPSEALMNAYFSISDLIGGA